MFLEVINSNVEFKIPLPAGTGSTTSAQEIFHQVDEKSWLRVEVTYTVTITHADANSGPAYDLALNDMLPSGMALVAGSLSTSVGSISSLGNTVTLTVPKLLVGDAAITVTYRAVFLDTVTPGQALTNTATLDYDTLEGPGGRAEALSSRRCR